MEIKVNVNGIEIEATINGEEITIYADGVWACDGKVDGGRIVDAPAFFVDQNTTISVYDAIEAEINA